MFQDKMERSKKRSILQIRPATPDDASAISSIWNPVIRDSDTTFNSIEKTVTGLKEMIRDKTRMGHAFYVAQDMNEVIGFATYGPFRSGPGYAHTMEHSVFLAPSAKRKGIGKSLMETIEDHARTAGIHSLIAGLSAQNLGGIAFHQSIGYQEVARINQVGYKFGHWHDLVLMQKLL
jgi:phosphinothricin acetyltransferase